MIHVIVAGDANYSRFVYHAEQSALKFGYDTGVYDLGGLGRGTPFDTTVSTQPFQTIPAKPRIIRHALEQRDPSDVVVWLDADALIQAPIDDIEQHAFDLGVTVRSKPHKDERTRTINAGIVFARATPAMFNFLDRWIQLSEELGGDQWALNRLVDFPIQLTDQTVNRGDLRVHGFPCRIYNNFMFKKPEIMAQARILHYKSRYRKLYPYD